MKNTNEIDDNINELIMQKSFNELSADEKKKAVEYAGSEAHYNTLRATLLAITTSFGSEEEVYADANVKNDLMNQFEKKFGKENNRVKIIPFYRKPLFQLAAAASIALLIFFSFPLLNSNQEKQGQLAMNSAGKETPAKETPGETVNASTAITSETGKVEDKAGHSATKKGLDANGPKFDNGKDEEKITDVPAYSAPIEQKEMAKGDVLNSDLDVKAVNDLKSADKNLALSKPASKTENDMFLLEEVNRKHREKDATKGKKEKEKSVFDDLSEAETKKESNLDQSQKDVIVNAATGSAYEAIPAAPGRVTATITANHFLEENNSAIMDLLFTTF
jgi:hypothetical protein